ncbi:MAG: AAA family ATPase, partial [bacterium]
MRVRECKIAAFGQICDRELRNLDSNLVVVLGPNEVGKSTLFEFFKTMIYGIYPTSPENHEYAPWSGRRLEGSLSFRLSDGSEHVVSRRLLKKPEGYILNEKRHNIRNQTIPAAAHISRQLFESIYALTLAEMAGIQDKPWHEIEERLLGDFKLKVLRPMKVVVKELEDEAASLWRDDNRGKPKARVLEKEINDLRKLAQAAANRDEET